MKKYFKYYLAVFLVAIAAFNAVAFLIPRCFMGVDRYASPAFWIGYAVIMIAFAAQLVAGIVFFRAKNAETAFLRFPLIRIAYAALITALVVGILFVVPAWIGAIVCVIITAGYVIAGLKAAAAAEAVIDVGEKVKSKTDFIRTLTTESRALINYATNDLMKNLTTQVYEDLRYSDPVSSPALDDIEDEIFESFAKFSKFVKAADDLQATDEQKKLSVLIADRNVKCKGLK